MDGSASWTLAGTSPRSRDLAGAPMAALVPLGGAQLRPRRLRGISATSDTGEERMERCITLAERKPFSDKMGTKRKRSTPRLAPELMEEIVLEILLRLPVKAIGRCQSVCKAWRAIISDPKFTQAHLRHSATNWERDPTFIISPLILDYVLREEEESDRWPTTFSNHIRFYQWRRQAEAATFIHEHDFGYQFNQLHYFSHCAGLVLAPTDTALYVFNPATRDAITLPCSERNNLERLGGRRACYCVGFGLDPRTSKCKVVQAFYYHRPSLDPRRSMGMEVFTIAGDSSNNYKWRKITNDPPYPAYRHQTGLSINGYLFWRIDNRLMRRRGEQPPRALLHLRLEDEGFGITRLPETLDPALDEDFWLDVLHGRELCLTASTCHETVLTIWTLPVVEQGLQGEAPASLQGRHGRRSVPGAAAPPRTLPPFLPSLEPEAGSPAGGKEGGGRDLISFPSPTGSMEERAAAAAGHGCEERWWWPDPARSHGDPALSHAAERAVEAARGRAPGRPARARGAWARLTAA